MSTKPGNAMHRRQPFATLAEAQAAAVQIANTSGWEVIEVLSATPGGPPRTSLTNHWSTHSMHPPLIPQQRPWARVPSVPPHVIARSPAGRRTTVGSWARWDALLAATSPRE
jgi:hypothetical protein